ncbi:MAG: hypothetical protein WCK51_12365 [Armatimonadota bacterium]
MMKLVFPTLILCASLFGCAPADNSKTSSTPSTSAAATEQKKCSACGTMVAAAEAQQKDGKTFCAACAAAHAGE